MEKQKDQKKYEEYKKRQAYTCSKEYMMSERGMTEEEWNEFNASRACTKENFILRYGQELGESKWKKYCDLEAYAGNKLEYFVNIYGEEDGLRRYIKVCREKRLNLENFIRKYGECDGRIKWKEYLESSKTGYSEISQELFRSIDIRYKESSLNSKFASKNGELCIEIPFGTSLKCFYFDYALFNKIIEFNGDYFHANPLMYKEDQYISKNGHGKYAKEIWEYDKNRHDAILKCGYTIKTVWESDYRSDPEKVLQECVEFLKS